MLSRDVNITYAAINEVRYVSSGFLYPRADPRPQGSPHTGGTYLLIRERAKV